MHHGEVAGAMVPMRRAEPYAEHTHLSCGERDRRMLPEQCATIQVEPESGAQVKDGSDGVDARAAASGWACCSREVLEREQACQCRAPGRIIGIRCYLHNRGQVGLV